MIEVFKILVYLISWYKILFHSFNEIIVNFKIEENHCVKEKLRSPDEKTIMFLPKYFLIVNLKGFAHLFVLEYLRRQAQDFFDSRHSGGRKQS